MNYPQCVLYKAPGESLELIPITKPTDNNYSVIKVHASVFGKALLRAMKVGHEKIEMNSILGTLISGEIVSENGIYQKGTRVVVNPHYGNLKRMVIAGHYCHPIVYPGGLSEYIYVKNEYSDSIYKIPDNVSYEQAVYNEILSCVYESIEKVQLSKHMPVLIVGSGLAAMLHIQVLINEGVEQVFCVCKSHREEKIAALGAIPIVYSDNITQMKNIILSKTRYPILTAFEAVGSLDALNICLSLIESRGRIILFGGYDKDTTLAVDLNELHYRQIQLIGTYHYTSNKYAKSLAFMSKNSFNWESMLTHTLSFERIHEAPEILQNPSCVTLTITY